MAKQKQEKKRVLSCGRALLALGFLVAGFIAVRGYQFFSLPEELRWSSEKITASPENTTKFIRARLQRICDQLSPATRHPIFAGSAKSSLQNFLDSDELEKGLATINEGHQLAKETDLEITLFPDEHPNAASSSQSKKSVSRQKEISKLIQTEDFEIVFAEGLEDELNLENLYQGFKRASLKIGTSGHDSYQDFEDMRKYNGLKFWWEEFLGKSEPKVIRIDDHIEINYVVTLIANLKCKEVTREDLINTAHWLNFTYRDQLILANTAIKMNKEKVKRAGLVLGEGHIESQKHYCKEWGIKLKVTQY
ncbi:MAG: hypothetical protein ABIP54_04840 [Candidatus Andersenbacteria bacterium]